MTSSQLERMTIIAIMKQNFPLVGERMHWVHPEHPYIRFGGSRLQATHATKNYIRNTTRCTDIGIHFPPCWIMARQDRGFSSPLHAFTTKATVQMHDKMHLPLQKVLEPLTCVYSKWKVTLAHELDFYQRNLWDPGRFSQWR